jgi:hypothetical protein
MRKHYFRILIALIGVAALGMATKGQAVDQIVVTISHGFVAAGQTLPAGTYRVNRLSDTDLNVLTLTSVENRASTMFLASTRVESNSSEKIQVSFERVGGQYFLSKIETADHAFTIPVSRSEILEASARSQSGTSVSESSAGN